MILQTPPDTIDMSMRVIWNIGTFIYSGVFMRFPKLKVISAENDAGWAAYYLPRMDMNVGDLQRVTKNQGGIDYELRHGTMKPSEYFHRNVFLSFQRDLSGIQMRHAIGVDNMMWGADYPHMEGTWPNSQQTFQWLFKGVPDAEKRKMVRDNCAMLYDFDAD
ncbi:MAG: amidohydrolase family protein, partial [Chloroflexi bacterium]|nr:amidohydrolase family protein [Chloroflexota bacterium]